MQSNEAKSPASVWDIVKQFVNRTGPGVSKSDDYLAKLPALFSGFPQILVSTAQWPDTDPALARRRRAFSRAVVRRVVHLALQAGDQARQVEALVSLLAVLEDRQPRAWRNIFTQLLQFWERLNQASRENSNTSQTCEIFLKEDNAEDEMFNQNLNSVVLLDWTVTERVEVLLTRIISTQVKFSLEMTTTQTIQSLALDQLELGGSELKSFSLELLTSLHQTKGLGVAWLWTQECALLVQFLNLFSRSDLSPLETESLSSSWRLLLTSTLPLMKRDHLLTLSVALLQLWQSQPDLSCLPPQIADLVSLLLQKVVPHMKSSSTSTVSQLTATSNTPDFELLGAIASSELLQNKEFRGSISGEVLVVDNLSPSWKLVLENFEGRLSLSELERFSAIVKKILIDVVTEKPEVKMELLSLGLLENLTEQLSSSLVKGDTVGPALECLKVLLQSGHLLPPDPGLSSLHHSWAALLSLPWLSHLKGRKHSDLVIGDNVRALIENNEVVRWSSEDCDTALVLLGFLPPSVCPRHRLAVLKVAWDNKSVGVVQSLPSVVGLSNSAADFAREVVKTVTGRVEQMEAVMSLATVSSSYICSLAKRTVTVLVSHAPDRLEFSVRCLDCSPSSLDSSTTSSTIVASKDLEDVLRLVGHQDNRIRLKLVMMIPSAAAHCVLTPEAVNLWMTSISDEDQAVRFAFANKVGVILRFENILSVIK